MSDPKEFDVHWSVTIEADTPAEAAEIALAMHRDDHNPATVFQVEDPVTGVCTHHDPQDHSLGGQ